MTRAPSATPLTSMSSPPITPEVTGVNRAWPSARRNTPGRSPAGGTVRSTTLCSGTVRTFVRSLVTISASQVSPGRRPGSGWSSRTTTLNSRAAAPVPLTGSALAPISTTLPGKLLAGQRLERDHRRLAHRPRAARRLRRPSLPR